MFDYIREQVVYVMMAALISLSVHQMTNLPVSYVKLPHYQKELTNHPTGPPDFGPPTSFVEALLSYDDNKDVPLSYSLDVGPNKANEKMQL